MPRTVFLFVLLAGCGPSSRGKSPPGADDGALSPDLVMRAGSDGGRDAAGADMAYAGRFYRFVVDKVYFPQMKGQYGYASNGDGFPHDQFAVFADAMAQKGLLPLGPAEDTAVVIDGDGLSLVSLGTIDPNLAGDAAAFATLYVADPQRQPDLGGTGSFLINMGYGNGRLGGALTGGVFSSTEPVRLAADPTVPIRIALLSTQRVTLLLHGAHITFTAAADGLMKGQLNGAIRQSDMDKIFIPALAQNLTLLEKKANCDFECMQVKTLFDVLPKDGLVSPDEVKGSFLQYPLMPDEQLFDARGQWGPNVANTSPDSFSFGVGFTAKKAMFNE